MPLFFFASISTHAYLFYPQGPQGISYLRVLAEKIYTALYAEGPFLKATTLKAKSFSSCTHAKESIEFLQTLIKVIHLFI